MQYTIENEFLTVTAETFGAQLVSAKSKETGTEYIWQRDPDGWHDSAPNLFPYIARLTEGKYTFEGKTYEMKIHGFVKYTELSLTQQTEGSMTFALEASNETKAQFPWDFLYQITYTLEQRRLKVTVQVTNRDTKTMYFGEGGHPGFAVPMRKGLAYEDYYVELPQAQNPQRIGFTPACFRDGTKAPLELPENKRIRLSHSLFADDAIVMENAGHQAVIGSDQHAEKLIITWTHPYLGIWSRTWEADYVCIEPWGGLPAMDGGITDFAKQPELNRLEPGETYTSEWSMCAVTEA